jgi:hypothetical protein
VDDQSVVVVGCHWPERHSELAYITRSLAGAASRWADVSVLATRADLPSADGAFDIEPLNVAGEYRWPDRLSSGCIVLVDDLTTEVATLLSKVEPREVFYVVASAPELDPAWRILPLTRQGDGSEPFVKVFVPINPLATLHRHNGFGFTGYHLVLSGPTGSDEGLTSDAAWLTAGMHDANVIVVENGLASAWKGRALRGVTSVDSRMDLWRLVAHACVCIDLSPGPHLARECVEAMRFGTPVIVPAGSGAGAVHAAAGKGSVYADPAELLEAAMGLRNAAARSAASQGARSYADANYGGPTDFVESLRQVLASRQALT